MAKVRVSDHALVRYMERVQGVDLDNVRSAILTDDVKAAMLAGASGVPIGGGHTLVCQGGTVVSVVPSAIKSAHRRKTQRGYDPEVDACRKVSVYIAD